MDWFSFSFLSIGQYILLTIYFVLTIIISLEFPGWLIIHYLKIKLSILAETILSLSIGIAAWITQAYIFGYLQIRYATYGYILLSIILVFKHKKQFYSSVRLFFKSILSNKSYIWIIIIAGIGIVGQTIQSIPSSVIFPEGWYTFIADDSLYHFGLVEELTRHMPPEQPGLSGVRMTGYHYFSNLAIADYARVFHLPIFYCQFFGWYILLSLLFGSLMYILLRGMRASRVVSVIAMILAYFSSDIIYIVTYITSHIFIFNVHPYEDGTMFLENPPRAFSYVLFLTGMYLLLLWIKNKSFRFSLLIAIVFGIIIGCKVHTGLMVIFGMVGFGLYSLLKRDWRNLYIPFGTMFITLCVYLPTNSASGIPLYSPFEIVHMFAVQPLLQTSWLELRRRIYLAHVNTIRVLQMDLMMLGFYFLAQFGIRNFGWLGLITARKILDKGVYIFLCCALFGTMAFGTLFIQPIAWADIFNSYLAGALVLSIFTALFFENIIRKNLRYGMLVLCICLCVLAPRWIYRMNMFVKAVNKATPVIHRSELQAAEFIRVNSDPQSIVFVTHNTGVDSIWSYVSGLTNRSSFLSGFKILNDRSIPYKDREKITNLIFQETIDPSLEERFLRYKIDYIFSYNSIQTSQLLKKYYKTVYSNDMITIYQRK